MPYLSREVKLGAAATDTERPWPPSVVLNSKVSGRRQLYGTPPYSYAPFGREAHAASHCQDVHTRALPDKMTTAVVHACMMTT